MLKVLYDNIIFNLQKSGGISVYWKEMIQRIIKEHNVNVKFIEYNDAEHNIFRKDIEISKKNVLLKKTFPTIHFWRYLNLKSSINNNKLIFHSSYYRTMKGKNVINVVTVHDFTYERKVTKLTGKLHVLQKKKALQDADGIICISENTKKDMLQLYPHLQNKKIKIIYNGFNSQDYYPIPNKIENSILFVGARKGYKNFKEVVEILSGLENISLDIVGPPLDQEELELLNQKIPNRYILHNHISNEELNIIYNKSICLLYLSEYEGFGIPVLEAMSAGCPVIALKKSSIPEVAGEAGILFDEVDYESIRKALIKLMEDKEYRDRQISLGLSNSKRFSWEECYEQVIKFYKELI